MKLLRTVNWETLTTDCGEIDDDGVAATVLIISVEGEFDRGGDVISWNCYGCRRYDREASRITSAGPELELIKAGVLQDQIFTTRPSSRIVPHYLDVQNRDRTMGVRDRHTHGIGRYGNRSMSDVATSWHRG